MAQQSDAIRFCTNNFSDNLYLAVPLLLLLLLLLRIITSHANWS